jgi:hypothetical protein
VADVHVLAGGVGVATVVDQLVAFRAVEDSGDVLRERAVDARVRDARDVEVGGAVREVQAAARAAADDAVAVAGSDRHVGVEEVRDPLQDRPDVGVGDAVPVDDPRHDSSLSQGIDILQNRAGRRGRARHGGR